MARSLLLRAFKRDENGVAAIEVAMIFPIIITLAMGGVEFAYQAIVRATLDSAIRSASRVAITGSSACQDGVSRTDIIVNSIKNSINGVIVVGNFELPVVSARVIHTESSVGASGEPDDPNSLDASGRATRFLDYNRNCVQERTATDVSSSGAGGPGDLVVYEVSYRTKFLLPFVGQFVGNPDAIISYTSQLMVRNEPWGSSDVSTNKP